MPTVYAYVCAYLSVPTCLCLLVCAYLSMPTCLCLRLCLPVCAYLSVPTYLCLPACAYLSMPTVCAYRPCLPSVPVCAYLSMPTVYAYLYVLLCLPVYNLGERSAQSKAPSDLINWLIILIQIILYGCSLAVHSNSSCLGCLPRRPWFDSAIGRYQSSSSIQSINWLNRLWCSLPSYLNGHRLVLVMVVVWFW